MPTRPRSGSLVERFLGTAEQCPLVVVVDAPPRTHVDPLNGVDGDRADLLEDLAGGRRHDAAHDDARATFLPAAESVTLYFTKLAYDIHWDEVGDYAFPSTNRTVLSGEAEVLDALRSVMWGHPTQRVRDRARMLHDTVVNLWFDVIRVAQRGDGNLSQDEASDLVSAGEELVQLIHAAETSDPQAETRPRADARPAAG